MDQTVKSFFYRWRMQEEERKNLQTEEELPESYLVDDPTLDMEEDEERRRSVLITPRTIKLGTALVFSMLIFIFAGIAWFTMNRETSTSGMGVKVQGLPYTIQTRDGSGYYKEKWDMIGSDALEWKISLGSNFDNHDDAIDPSKDETEPGLEPGDKGSLEFRVTPNTSDSITVDCVFDFKAYLEEPVLGESGEKAVDEDDNPIMKLTEIEDEDLAGYIKAHIMLFSEYDTETKKYSGLIATDDELRRVLENQIYTRNGTDYTKIYWVWPEHLEELTSNDPNILIYAETERNKVINYIAANRNGFFKDCSDTKEKVIADLTALSTAYDNSIYNHYNIRYDNADLDIGNGITYVMLSMTVEQ